MSAQGRATVHGKGTTQAKVTPISGFPELLPAERLLELHFLDVIREVFELHGFASLETRAVEPVSRLLGKGGDADKEIYGIHRLADGAGADTDLHAVFNVSHRGATGAAFQIILTHCGAFFFSKPRMKSYCDLTTGITDRREPRCTRAKSSNSGQALSSFSVMQRLSLRSNLTSTSIQRGCSGVLFGSWYTLRGSNWVGSG